MLSCGVFVAFKESRDESVLESVPVLAVVVFQRQTLENGPLKRRDVPESENEIPYASIGNYVTRVLSIATNYTGHGLQRCGVPRFVLPPLTVTRKLRTRLIFSDHVDYSETREYNLGCFLDSKNPEIRSN